MTRHLEGWSLEVAQWRSLAEVLRDATQWTVVVFDQLYVNNVPPVPGVYMVAGCPPVLRGQPHTTFSKPLYIGRADDLRVRFRTHTGGSCQASVRALRTLYSEAGFPPSLFFHALPVPLDLTERAESLLIDCYGPPANRIRGLRLKAGIPAG